MKTKKQPALTDPCWPERCAPLLCFLSEPRDWPALKLWRKTVRVNECDLRNNLAYLESTSKIYAFYANKVVFWAQVGVTLPLDEEKTDPTTILLDQLLPAEPQPVRRKVFCSG